MSLGPFGLSANGQASDLSIGNAGVILCTPVAGLVGMQAFSASLNFFYGAGGSSVKAYLQSSLDQGNTWFDIACCAFAQVSRPLLLNFSGLTPRTTEVVPGDGEMTDDTAIDGILGDRVRMKVIVVGTYTNSTLLKGRMVAR